MSEKHAYAYRIEGGYPVIGEHLSWCEKLCY